MKTDRQGTPPAQNKEFPVQWTEKIRKQTIIMNEIKIATCTPTGSAPKLFTEKTAKKTSRFHASFPEYSVTPLAALNQLAKRLGVESIHVKDESYRFGLNAFKVLGGTCCLGTVLAHRLGLELEDVSCEMLTSGPVREKLGDLTFVSATDGNHGRGIAWTASKLRQRSVIYMPKGSAAERLENIRKAGAEASITEFVYDDTVRFASEQAARNGWILTQDTSWEGYEEIPTWIMEGYTTLAMEMVQALPKPPTHVFLQAGVGSMAGAVAGFLADHYGTDKPVITVVEPHKADCHYRTALAGDGRLHSVDGPMDTIMAGLACGTPCGVSWRQLEAYAEHYISMPDFAAANGMRVLGNPLPGDPFVLSGESGASGFGCVYTILADPAYRSVKEALGINEESRILCVSTEGDTDRENYRRIVWEGKVPAPRQ